jgi:hypothetical protein
MGIEPTLAAWEAAVLPLNYTRTGALILGGKITWWQFDCSRSGDSNGGGWRAAAYQTRWEWQLDAPQSIETVVKAWPCAE